MHEQKSKAYATESMAKNMIETNNYCKGNGVCRICKKGAI